MPRLSMILLPIGLLLLSPLPGTGLPAAGQVELAGAGAGRHSHDERIEAIERRLMSAAPTAAEADADWSIGERMRAHRVPGFSVAMIHGGRVAWTRAYGTRNASGDRVTTATLFQAGSLSKVVAAATALRAAETGTVDLDADVNRYLQRWRIPASRFTEQRAVTLRHLLTHSAGVTVRGFDGYVRGTPLPTLVQTLNGESPANNAPVRVEATPASANRYSGGGFMIAQLVLEDATDTPFERLARRLVFDPLHLTRSTFASVSASDNNGDIATGFDTTGAEIDGGWRELPEQAAASLWSTPTELASFIVALQHSVRGDTSGLVQQTTARGMMRPQGPGRGQGIGVGLKMRGDSAFRFSHTGSNDGFQAMMIGYLDRGEGIVVMANGDDGNALAMEYVRAVAHTYGWEDLAPPLAPAQTAQAQAVVLPRVTVIDGTGGAPQPEMTIVVNDGRISAIYRSGTRANPPGARILDVEGYYVIPGLIDSHVHLASFDRPPELHRELLRYALLGGVTTVRDMGGNAERVMALARESRNVNALSPRVYGSAVFAGPRWFANYDTTRLRYWSGNSAVGQAPGARLIGDTTNVAAAVQAARRLGVSGIKLYSDLAPARIGEITRLAHSAGLKVWAHAVVPPSRPDDVVAAGVDAVSHGDQLIWTAAPPGGVDGARTTRARLMATTRANAPAMSALYWRMLAANQLFEPTLLVMQMGRFSNNDFGAPDSVPAWAIEATKQAHAAGVPIVAGTDAIGRQSPFLHAELQLLVRQAGLTPLEAIRAATLNGAKALGLQDSVGTVQVQKWADLVVLRADPSRDIRNTQTVRYVLRGGQVHERTGSWSPVPGPASVPPAP